MNLAIVFSPNLFRSDKSAFEVLANSRSVHPRLLNMRVLVQLTVRTLLTAMRPR